MRLKLASRKSDLARWQAVQVAHAFEQITEKPSIEFSFKSSFGDQNLDLPLAGMGARGVFTEDFYKDLTEGRCDLVVHSWKDLPIEERESTLIAMTLPRADVRDLLLIPEAVWQAAQLSKKLIVLTSSPRRIYNLTPILPKLLPGNISVEFRPVRGNVPTRLRKMHDEAAALVLAKAGLDRLLEAGDSGFVPQDEAVRPLVKDCRFMVLPVSLNPPAPAQGALAVEIARSNVQLNEICGRLSDHATFRAAQEEREVLSRHGGGCHQKIGVARLPRIYGMVCATRGQTDAGEILNEWRLETHAPWGKAKASECVFPRKAQDNSWFTREPQSTDPRIKEHSAIFVARADAYPKDYLPRNDQVLWTAGVQSWYKLAEMGLFVNGCQDGLGENEAVHLDALVGPVRWCKLTHDSAHTHPKATTIITYKLIAKNEIPDLTGCTHFFWMSGTSYEAAYKAYPEEVAGGYNACGPGHTYDFLRARSELQRPVRVVMGLEQFLLESLP